MVYAEVAKLELCQLDMLLSDSEHSRKIPCKCDSPFGQVLVEIEEDYKAYPLKNSNGSDSINITGF